jgi:DNA-directed RNA polymerase specialized sigma24 family protein
MPDHLPEPDRQRFQATRWSMVLRTRGDTPIARKALEDLCGIYWFPLYAWCRSRGYTSHDAEDLIQGFFLKIIQNQLFGVADPARGKLRTFLLTALKRHIRDEADKAKAIKRGGGQVIPIDPATAEACYSVSLISGESPEQAYDRQWALTVLDHALGLMEKEAIARGRHLQFTALRRFLTEEGNREEYAIAAVAVGMSPGSFKVAVHRLRGRFRETLSTVVSDTQPEGSNSEEEIAYLARMLASS